MTAKNACLGVIEIPFARQKNQNRQKILMNKSRFDLSQIVTIGGTRVRVFGPLVKGSLGEAPES